MTIKLAMRIAAVLMTLTLIAVMLPETLAQRPGPIIRQPGPLVIGGLATGPTITFDKQLPTELLTRAANLRVYRLAPPRFDQAFFNNFLQRGLGGIPGEQIKVGQMTAVSDERSNFAMLDPETGLLSFSMGMADQIDDRPGELPDERRARALARDFLVANDLFPRDEKQVTAPHVGHIRSAAFNPETGQETGPMLQMLSIYFGRLIDDTEVMGSASKMVVQIGDGGKVVGAGINWREIGQTTNLSARQLRGSEQLMSDIRSFLTREFVQGERLTVRQMGLFYYDGGANYIQPVIGFEVLVRAGEMPTYNYFGLVPLLSNPPEMVGLGPLSQEATRALRQGTMELAPPTQPGD